MRSCIFKVHLYVFTMHHFPLLETLKADLPKHLISYCLLFHYKWHMLFKCGRFIDGGLFFPSLHLSSTPIKLRCSLLLVFQIQTFLILIYVFSLFSFLIKFYFFFQFNIWFLICIYNIFRFGYSTFNFLFFSFTLLSKFL